MYDVFVHVNIINLSPPAFFIIYQMDFFNRFLISESQSLSPKIIKLRSTSPKTKDQDTASLLFSILFIYFELVEDFSY